MSLDTLSATGGSTRKKYQHFCLLVKINRMHMGNHSLKQFFEGRTDLPIDYQTWTHIEAGRRLPNPKVAVAVADILGIPLRDALVAYVKDLFVDERVHDLVGQLNGENALPAGFGQQETSLVESSPGIEIMTQPQPREKIGRFVSNKSYIFSGALELSEESVFEIRKNISGTEALAVERSSYDEVEQTDRFLVMMALCPFA